MNQVYLLEDIWDGLICVAELGLELDSWAFINPQELASLLDGLPQGFRETPMLEVKPRE